MTIDHLFNQIVDEMQAGQITGWCPIEKALDLAVTVVALRPKMVVELGVWGGRSLLPMALACEAIDHGVVVGIDPWSPAASVEGYDAPNVEWWGKQDHEQIYRGFLAHVERLGLKNRVAIERAKSDNAAVPGTVDFLHVDGQHCEQALRDVRKFGAAVRVGGIVCMDDIEWQTAGVQHVKMAILELQQMGFVELYRRTQKNGNWGMFQRVSMSKPIAARSAVTSKKKSRNRS